MPVGSMWSRIADDIRVQIRLGDLPPGAKLPSTSELCRRYGVSTIVVRQAINELKAQRLVEGLSGAGVFVADTTAKTKWERLALHLRRQIESGGLAAGDKLPSTSQLSAEHGVSAIVVRQAIFTLRTEGLIEGVQGVGVFVVERS